jgi:hypothetical protein
MTSLEIVDAINELYPYVNMVFGTYIPFRVVKRILRAFL